MRRYFIFIPLIISFFLYSCSSSKKSSTRKVNVLSKNRSATKEDDVNQPIVSKPVEKKEKGPMISMAAPLDIDRKEFVNYAKTFLGTPYKYASSNPENGLDCSGLLYHIFQHYNVKSPRSSYDYENVGKTVSIKDALPGDIILFTGENTKRIGHMGIITENKAITRFIHSSSSRSGGVIISTLVGYYETHFVKIIRVLQ